MRLIVLTRELLLHHHMIKTGNEIENIGAEIVTVTLTLTQEIAELKNRLIL